MAWRYERWTADHRLPIGVVQRPDVGERVNAGDVIATGVGLGTASRLLGARRIGVPPGTPAVAREVRLAARWATAGVGNSSDALSRTTGNGWSASNLAAPGDVEAYTTTEPAG